MNTTKTRGLLHPKKRKTNEKKNKELFAEAHTVAPAPRRDYYALQLYQKKFLWTQWKISHGPFSNPIQRIVSMEEFLRDVTLQNELTYIFGADITSLIRDLAQEKWSLVSMPSIVLQKIFSYLSVPDILRLSQVCKRLSKECSKNDLWKIICKKQWKILIHNDSEKANLIGWKNVYLEKMRPKRYKTDPAHPPKPNIMQRNRLVSISALNTPDSRASTVKSNFTIHKRVQDLKKSDTLRTSSEIFGKDFKVMSTSTGKSTERTLKGRCNSRNSDFRPISSGKLNITPRSNADRKYFQQPSHSILTLVPLAENPKQGDTVRKNKSPRTAKCKVTSIRARSSTAQPVQPPELQCGRLRTDSSRPSTGKHVKAKQKLYLGKFGDDFRTTTGTRCLSHEGGGSQGVPMSHPALNNAYLNVFLKTVFEKKYPNAGQASKNGFYCLRPKI